MFYKRFIERGFGEVAMFAIGTYNQVIIVIVIIYPCVVFFSIWIVPIRVLPGFRQVYCKEYTLYTLLFHLETDFPHEIRITVTKDHFYAGKDRGDDRIFLPQKSALATFLST